MPTALNHPTWNQAIAWIQPWLDHPRAPPRLRTMLEDAAVIACAGGLRRNVNGTVTVPAQSTPNIVYTVTPPPGSACDCPAWHTPQSSRLLGPSGFIRLCKHQLAVALCDDELDALLHPILNLRFSEIRMSIETSAPVTPNANTAALDLLQAQNEFMVEQIKLLMTLDGRLESINGLLLALAENLEPPPQPTSPPVIKTPAFTSAPVNAQQFVNGFPGRRTTTLAANAIAHDISNNKHVVTVKGGPWQRYGIRVWPEVLPRLGFNTADDIPLGAHEWDATVIVQIDDQDQPVKVLGLAAI